MTKSYKEQIQEKYYTIQEFIEHTGLISISGCYKKIKKGIIPVEIIENKTYIPRDWVRKNYDEKIEAALAKVAE